MKGFIIAIIEIFIAFVLYLFGLDFSDFILLVALFLFIEIRIMPSIRKNKDLYR